MSGLEVRGLACRRGSAELFAGLSFCVEPGMAAVVRGANGSGKTTLLRVLAGFAAPEAGEVDWNGQRMATAQRTLRRAPAVLPLYLGHAAPLKDDLTVLENLFYALRFDGIAADGARCLEALHEAGLGSRRGLYARQLSQGQRRRIGIARLRLARRALWLLDEPAAALDAAGLELLAGTVDEHLARGGTAVITSHQPLALRAAALDVDLAGLKGPLQ